MHFDRALEELNTVGPSLRLTIETYVHAEHVTGMAGLDLTANAERRATKDQSAAASASQMRPMASSSLCGVKGFRRISTASGLSLIASASA